MSTQGFEFAYRLDGGNATPLMRDMILSAAAAVKIGDLMGIESDGDVTKVTTPAAEVVGVAMEPIAAAAITAGTTKIKVAILSREQVWRCSMDAATTALINGYNKTVDTVDCNTVSSTDVTGGKMILVDTSELDDEGNVLAYVVFSDTTYGNT